jgi:hypothetical protein
MHSSPTANIPGNLMTCVPTLTRIIVAGNKTFACTLVII